MRCFYCMPEKGISFLERKDLLSFDEMFRILKVARGMGVDKFRITGGEPFARKGIMPFLKKVKQDLKPTAFSITTNATLIGNYIEEVARLFQAVNVSLDALDKERFFEITRRDDYDAVIANIHALLDAGVQVKVNAVVLSGKNTEDILPFVEWTKNLPIEVRFIEEMPFNGTRDSKEISDWNYKKILEHIQGEFKEVEALPVPSGATSLMYQVKGFQGKFGIIPAFSRTFCGSCNRIRITPKGELRTCLYSTKGTDLLTPIRKGMEDASLEEMIRDAVMKKEKDGFAAAAARDGFIPIYESMTTIGG